MRSLALVALLFATHAHADVIRSLERGAAYAGQSKGNKTLFIPTRKGGIELRADGGNEGKGLIGINHAISQTGYSLGKDGKLSAKDRVALGAVLAKDGVTRESAVRGIRSSMLARRAHEAKLATKDATIDSMLADAKSVSGTKRYGRNVSIESGGPSGAMILVNERYSQRAIFLSGSKADGFTMTPSERAGLARVLLND